MSSRAAKYVPIHHEECRHMYVEDCNTEDWTRPLDGDVAQGVHDAQPVDLWGAWLFAAAESSLMLRAWSTAAIEHRMGAYAGYRAALDREAHAALVLANRLTTWHEGA
ncbi:MAG TPA: hypothetical protein VGO81_10725 [Solirubrobacteraceae bacterium]|jgi:hypothetical protein|nr:hypothetical protein [Solirubrobacteraceae bacterium]